MIHLYVDDAGVIYTLALHACATSLRESADQYYGDRTVGVQDPCGNQWWTATHKEEISPEELVKRAETFVKEQR